MSYPRAKGPWKRRHAIDDLVDPTRKQKARPKSWREVLTEDPRSPDELSYGHAWARLIKLRHVYDEAGVPLIDAAYYDEIVREATEWQIKYPTTRSDTVFEKVKAALWIANARRDEPELAPVDFG